MKKLLMGTTAVAGAVAILGGAAAMAQEAPTLTINGHSRFAVYMADQDVRAGNGKGYKFSTENTEIHFNLAGQADNGLRYSLKVEMDAQTHDAPGRPNADEVRIRLQGDWGIVDLGDEDGVEDLMPVSGRRILAGRGGWDGGIFNIFNPIGAKRTGPGIVGDTDDATKISYYTPRMAGFQAGVSFTPNVNQKGQAKRSDLDNVGMQNSWALGLAYQETFNEVSVSLGGAYTWATMRPSGLENVRAYTLGGWVGYAGFRVGGGYANSGRSGEATVNPTYSRDSWWDVAADYTAGPWRASVGHFRATGKSAIAGVSDDRVEITSFGVTYSIAPGLNAFGEVDLVRVRRDDTNGGTNKGTVGIIGTNISF